MQRVANPTQNAYLDEGLFAKIAVMILREIGVRSMPTYDYYCEANGEKIEVFHPMNETISNWGELCDKANRPLGDTGKDEPVRKLIGGAAVISSTNRVDAEPACPAGACCQGGSCGFNE